jgi:hypothetical protein
VRIRCVRPVGHAVRMRALCVLGCRGYRRKQRAGRHVARAAPKTAVTPLAPGPCVNPTRKGLTTMHTVEFHLSLTLIQSLVPILPRLRAIDRELARALRASATAIPRALAAAELAARAQDAARHRRRAHALARHVLALLLTAHAWHYEMPDKRSLALVQAEHLVEYLAPVA